MNAIKIKPEISPAPAEPKSSGPARYGDYYWCVKTSLSENGEIYLYADRASIEAGVLTFSRLRGEEFEPTLVLAPGQWTACFAASLLDGNAVAVEHWKGEVVR